MAITCSNPDAIQGFSERAYKELTSQVLIQLNYLGKECVNRVRDRPMSESWNDQTGNLRSSIGAVVVSNGKEQSRIKPVQTLQGIGGVSTATAELNNQVPNHQEDYALVVVAGMEYASYVEDMEGKDVLASTRLWCEAEVDARLRDAVANAAARLSK